jgi:hypothetical protein
MRTFWDRNVQKIAYAHFSTAYVTEITVICFGTLRALQWSIGLVHNEFLPLGFLAFHGRGTQGMTRQYNSIRSVR